MHELEVDDALLDGSRWSREQQKAWRKQIFEVQRWKQVRGLAGGVMCETRDLRIERLLDMRVVCAQHVEQKEGVWLAIVADNRVLKRTQSLAVCDETLYLWWFVF